VGRAPVRRSVDRGAGGKPERDEQAVRRAGVGHECDDAAATTARANQNVLGEHPPQQGSPRQPAGTRQDGLRSTGAGSVGRAVVDGGLGFVFTRQEAADLVAFLQAL
jgi:hypothetical protein